MKYAILMFLLTFQGPAPNKTTSKSVQKNAKGNHSDTPKPVTVTRGASSNDESEQGSERAKQGEYQSVKIISAPKIETESEKDPWDKALVVATWVLVFIGAGQIIFLWHTVNATRDNAVAARLNAEAVINSERPWLLFTEITGIHLDPSQQNIPTTVGLTFSNSGKTVAKMTAWKFGLFITRVGEVPPPNVFDTEGVNFKRTVIPKDGPLPHVAQLDGGRVITQQELDDITGRHTSHLWLCGILRYQDVFDPKIEHVTKVCRRYHVWGIEPMFVLDGPAQYNDET